MKRIHFISYFLLFSCSVFSQEFSKIVPVNPNVASLFKSTITPVNEYSGLANVSIPLYTVTEGNISVPISLSYNNSGIQVSEESGIVGLGWALNIGGAITRAVNGNDDFDTSSVGYLVHGKQYPDPYVFPGPNGYFDPNQHGLVNANSECQFLVNGNLTRFDQTIHSYSYQEDDFMPDVFYYSFSGYSGSFVLNRNGGVVLMKKEGLKILVSGGGQSVKFTITTEDGTIYEFNKTEFTNFSGSGAGIPGYTSSWYLSKITDISGNHIDFIYQNKENIVPLRSFTQNFEIDPCLTQNCINAQARFKEYAGPYTTIEGIYLSEIHFSTGKVKLNYSNYNDRTDLKGYYLNSIEIINNTNNIVKRHDFNYSYFGNSSNGGSKTLAQGDYSQSIYSLGAESHLNLRLRLDSVTEDSVKTHSFEYYPGFNNYVPNKTTLDQDYWGFYNGANNTRSFIPSVNPNISGNQGSSFVAANRVPSEVHAKLFSLKKITYPTKGSTVFEYQTNTFAEIALQTHTTRDWVTAKSDETTPYSVSVPFTPQTFPFKIEASFLLQAWNSSMSSSKPYVDFPNTFHLRLKKSDGTELKYYYFPSNEGNQKWNNVQGGSYAGYVYPAEEFGTQLNPTSGNQFTLEAYFNDRDGLLFGIATIKASWNATHETISSYYSKGGGLRVKSISDYDSDSSLKMKRAFNYHYESAVNGQVVQRSYGKLYTSKPRYERVHLYTYSGSYPTQVRNPVIVGSSNSINAFSKDAGSYVGYDQVETVYEGNNVDNGKQIKKFYNVTDNLQDFSFQALKGQDDYYRFPTLRSPRNGLNYLTQNYKRDGNTYSLISKIENDYSINGFSASNFDFHTLYQNPDYIIGAKKENFSLVLDTYPNCNYLQFQLHPYYSNLIQQTAIKETLYDTKGQNPVVNEQKFYYDNAMHLQKTRIESTNSLGEVLETKIYYPDDISSTASLAEGGNLISSEYAQINRLKTHDLHRIATPIQTVTKKNGQITSIQRNLFKTDEGIVLPSSVKTAKGTNSLEDRLVYHDYDNKGNPLEVSKKDGVHIVYVWGYNKTQPIAKIENATNAQIATALGVSDVSALNETNLAAINALRSNASFAGSMITTYTHIPLVGVNTITDPKNDTITYTYDAFGRLEFVKDKNGNILTENQYNYKQ